ncbi:hypothetical protein DDZ13_11030 [Coraliomargarita sinensis]|uniref:3-keto-disaccharide hydrolase domain-containing protein n=1 Tax=Coraliomargarita sinensis TaxID=2174842 RepID=A0A317ZJJ3_9BACT|nr:hypothetical protein [Coraliomargarita sinensis]PXA03511.1 hypothetical protein DDZ13_11030 [Coraliomargarita sinensis]
MIRQYSLSFALGISLLATNFLSSQSIPTQEIAEEWNFYGKGSINFQNRMLYMEETPGSKGVMVVSPQSYEGDIILRYELMPMSAASVCVAIICASDPGEAESLTLPENYDGSMGHWINSLDNYFFAFHNMAHDRKPFGMRFPTKSALGEHDDNVMRNGEFHSIEVGRKGKKLWLSVNGKRLFQGVDASPLQLGHIAFRIRGIPQQPASCLIRNVTIEQP